MKYLHTLALFLTLLFINQININAQTLDVSDKVKLIPGLPNLKVGDLLPDFIIPKIIRANKDKANTADFKNQLLIIDFWSIYCTGCVEALPKMDSLQKQFGNQIKILPVTFEAKALVENFWKKNRYIQHISLPSVVEDRHFSSYFRHKAIPHEVWVYKGKVIAITNAQYVDESNIKKVLSGEEINWPVKNDFYSFDGTKQVLFPLDKDKVDISSGLLRYTALGGYREGLTTDGLGGGSGIVRDSERKTIRTFLLNQSIYTAYIFNWGKLISLKDLVKPSLSATANQFVWEVKDRYRYLYNHKKAYQAEWIRKNGICFESLIPDTGQTDLQITRTLIQDLDRLLGLKVRWEKRKEKVLVLIRTTIEDKLKGKPTSGKDQRFIDQPLSQLVYTLNQQEGNPYIFDETAYKKMVNMELNISSWTDIASIRKELNRYGLDLKEEEREVDKFVFSEVNGGLLIPNQITK